MRLAQKLGAGGHAVQLAKRGGAGVPTPLIELLIVFERVVHRSYGPHAADKVRAERNADFDRAADLVIDLTGRPASTAERRVRLLYDGDPREEAAIAAILERRTPRLGLALSDASGAPLM